MLNLTERKFVIQLVTAQKLILGRIVIILLTSITPPVTIGSGSQDSPNGPPSESCTMTHRIRLANYRDQRTTGKSGIGTMLFCGVVAVTKLMQSGGLPEPLPTLNPARPRWLVSDLEDWIALGRPTREEFARFKREHESNKVEQDADVADLVCA